MPFETQTNQSAEAVLNPDEYGHILDLQCQIFELFAFKNNGTEILSRLCRLAESFLSNCVASVMIKDAQTGLMSVLSAPSIPPIGHEALKNLKPGPHGGSCGNAVFRNEPQYVENTFNDDRWCDLRKVAVDFNICSCWSYPIRDANRSAFGSFALSSFEHRRPSLFHQKLLEICAFIANIVLQKTSYEQSIERAEQEKIEAMKGLLSMLAHKWRQPLNALAINIQDVKYAFSTNEIDQPYVHNFVDSSMTLIRSMSETIDALRQDTVAAKKELFDVGTLFSDIIKDYTGGNLVSEIIYALDIDSQLPLVYADKHELRKVISLLLQNAHEAIGETNPQKPLITLSAHRKKESVVIGITDNGGGISDDVKKRMFEPYFTTKHTGDGMGLYAAKLTIEDVLQGTLSQQNTDNGSCFELAIPL